MPRTTAGRAAPESVLSELAHVYRRFAEGDVAKTSPLYSQIALTLSESDEALRAIETAPARKRHPTVILAALHDLTLTGQAPELAAAFTAAVATSPNAPTADTTTSSSNSSATQTGATPAGANAIGRTSASSTSTRGASGPASSESSTTTNSTTPGRTTGSSTTASRTTGSSTTPGTTTGSSTTAGSTTAGSTTAGSTTAGTTSAGTTSGGTTSGGTTSGSGTTAGSASAGRTAAGPTSAGDVSAGTRGTSPEAAEAAEAWGRAAAVAAVEAVVRLRNSVAAVAAGRKVRANESGRYAVLYPAVAEVARRVGADAVGLIDVGRAAGLNLNVDRVGVAYSNGQSLGDPEAPIQVSASVVGDRAVPTRVIPEVVARVVVDADPVHVADAESARWLRACLAPDQTAEIALLERELEVAAALPRIVLPGEVVDVLPDALARVPEGVLPVVTTTWALSSLPLESRLRFVQRLDEAATHRPVAWVSVEGVGVAPGIPTFGDRHASGHSIIGLAIFRHGSLHADAVGRTWSQGRLLSWLADS